MLQIFRIEFIGNFLALTAIRRVDSSKIGDCKPRSFSGLEGETSQWNALAAPRKSNPLISDQPANGTRPRSHRARSAQIREQAALFHAAQAELQVALFEAEAGNDAPFDSGSIRTIRLSNSNRHSLSFC